MRSAIRHACRLRNPDRAPFGRAQLCVTTEELEAARALNRTLLRG
jgi:hypothetical protein